MYTVLLVIHVMVVIALIGIILVQRSASDGMGLSGSSSNSFISGRTAANFLTHTTAVLAILFMLCSLGLGILTSRSHAAGSSILDRLENKPAAAAPAPSGTLPAPAPAAPNALKVPAGKPATPSVPRPE